MKIINVYPSTQPRDQRTSLIDALNCIYQDPHNGTSCVVIEKSGRNRIDNLGPHLELARDERVISKENLAREISLLEDANQRHGRAPREARIAAIETYIERYIN